MTENLRKRLHRLMGTRPDSPIYSRALEQCVIRANRIKAPEDVLQLLEKAIRRGEIGE